MMKEVSDVKETAEEINGLKNKVSEVRSINYFIINCISSPSDFTFIHINIVYHET